MQKLTNPGLPAGAALEQDPPQWRLTMWAMVGVQVVMSTSFSFLSPIMPLFLPALGVHTESAVDFWSGLLASVTSFVGVFTQPMWGRMADTYGRKLMVLRSSHAISIFTILMGFVTDVWQMLALRVLMGAFAGFSAASVVMVASAVPERRLGYALGVLSSGQLVGSLMGPLLGGGLADLTGSLRQPFYVAGAIGLVAFALCWAFVPERFTKPTEKRAQASWMASVRMISRSQVLVALVMVLMLTQFATQAIQPLITLFVQELEGDRPDLGTLAGLAFSATGLAGVLAVPVLGRAADHIGERQVLLLALAGAALFTAPQAIVHGYWGFLAERFGLGLFVGGIIPAANALVGKMTDSSDRGFIYGTTASAYFLGNALGPLTGGAVGAAFGLRWVFVVTAVLLVAALAWVYVAPSGARNKHREDELADLKEIREKLFCALLSDVMDALGCMDQAMPARIRPLDDGSVMVGRARTALFADVYEVTPNVNPYELEIALIDSLGPDEIPVFACGATGRIAPWGELLSTASKARGAVGALMDGMVRDIKAIRAMGFPVFHGGIGPLDSKGRGKTIAIDVPIACAGVKVSTGDLIFGDADGVVVVPKALEERVLAAAFEKLKGERNTLAELRAGSKLGDVYAKYGVL